MKRSSKLVSAVAMVAALVVAGSPAAATQVFKRFAFHDATNAGVASGSFRYETSGVGAGTQRVGFDHLAGFRLEADGLAFDSGFVAALAGDPGAYRHFGLDRSSGRFVPAAVTGAKGPVSGILAAVNGALDTGFFFDPPVGAADPAGTGAKGLFAIYNGGVRLGLATRYSISAVPEPGVWVMGLCGFAIVGATLRRRPGMAVVAA